MSALPGLRREGALKGGVTLVCALRFLVILPFAFSLCHVSPEAQPPPGGNPAEFVKVGIFYNIVSRTEWPRERLPATNAPMVLGILGKDPFGASIDHLKKKRIKDRTLEVRYLEGARQSSKDLQGCHILFISSSENAQIGQILDQLENSSILTFSEGRGVCKRGVMISLIWKDAGKEEKSNMMFNTNEAALKSAGLEINSAILRMVEQWRKNGDLKDAK